MNDRPDQATLWEEILAPKWIHFRPILAKGLAVHSQSVIEGQEVKSDARILDVGCGFGDTSLAWAQDVPNGQVLGLDISRSFIELACKEAADYANCTFEVADCSTYRFEENVDLVYSRFGCMFFERSSAAFSNLHSALTAQGELLLQVWRPRDVNPWFTEAVPAILEILPEPEDFGPRDGPGPFAMSDPEKTKAVLAEAGFQNVEFEVWDVDMPIGDDMEEAITFQMGNGPVGQVIREAWDLAVDKESEIREALLGVLQPFQTSNGEVHMPSSSWLIRANAK